MGAQKIASCHPGISASMCDLRYFPEEKKQYGILSVPCIVIDGETVFFGKKKPGTTCKRTRNKERQGRGIMRHQFCGKNIERTKKDSLGSFFIGRKGERS